MNGMNNAQLANMRAEFVSNGVSSVSLKFIDHAKGALLYDVEGNEYIDFAGGIGAMNVGHGHPKVVAAIKDQAEKLTHSCFFVNPYPIAMELSKKLCALVPGDFEKKVAYFTSGAEAVENAVKVARYYTKRPAIIVFDNAYHGRTQLTMTMTSKVKPFKMGFGPFAPEVYRMPFGDQVPAEYMLDFFAKNVNPEAVAAVVVEPVQGEGGFIAAPEGYFQTMAKICKDHGILFVSDEIQAGMGRTGKMFSIEHWGVEPDLMCVGKSLAAGMPISAVVGRKELLDSVHVGGLGGTYGGNPVACAAAMAVLEIFEQEGLLEASVALGQKLGARFGQWVNDYPEVGEIRGLGAMRGFTLVDQKGNPSMERAVAVVKHCHENGVVALSCGTYGNVVRVLAPLVITDGQLAKGLDIMEQGIKKLSA